METPSRYKPDVTEKKAAVWYVDINNHKNQIPYYWGILNTKERERVNKFYFEKDKNCYIIARGILRTLLAKYLNLNPSKIKFQYTEKGKPFLKHSSNIKFNISHSKNTIVLGFLKNDEIGVDVEFSKNKVEALLVAKSFFSKNEIKALHKLTPSYIQQGFYNCWTRKEAFIKAIGHGLSFPLDQFEVSLESTEIAILKETLWDVKEKEFWTLKSFIPFKDYIGAVAIRNRNITVDYFHFQETDSFQKL